ncbi:MAG: hypothetical protein R2774_00085 [Saprospiraceae bacterium]
MAIAWTGVVGGSIVSYPAWVMLGPHQSWISILGVIAAIGVITIPILWIIFGVSRMAFKFRPKPSIMNYLLFTWIVCIVLTSFTIMKTIKEYSMEAIDQNNMTLSSISENLITIKADGNSEHTLRLNFGPLQFLNNDGFNAKEWVIPVTEVVVRKHHDANTVKVTKKLLARGSSNYDAKENLKKISTEVTQSGNIIYVPQGIILGPNERFRDQRLVLEFDVPISMQVEIDPNLQLRSYQVEEMDGIKTKF